MEENKLKDKHLLYVVEKYIIPKKKFDFNEIKSNQEVLDVLNGFEKLNRLSKEEKDELFDLIFDNTMKLHIELIPRTTWGRNVRTSVKKSEWDKIRKTVYEKANMKCQICNEGRQTLHAHEVWDFDEEKHIQKLEDIIGICEDCHNTIHYGRAQKIGTHQKAKEHFLKVNRCNVSDWQDELDIAKKDFLRRSLIDDWKLDISLIEKYGI